jgi:hypothetical protein
MKPFTLTGGRFTMKVSGGLSGIYTYTGPYDAHGGQSYGILLLDRVGKPGTMTDNGNGCVETPKDTFCNNAAEKYELTPIDPASGCSQKSTRTAAKNCGRFIYLLFADILLIAYSTFAEIAVL